MNLSIIVCRKCLQALVTIAALLVMDAISIYWTVISRRGLH